jgi:hypothetical protein
MDLVKKQTMVSLRRENRVWRSVRVLNTPLVSLLDHLKFVPSHSEFLSSQDKAAPTKQFIGSRTGKLSVVTSVKQDVGLQSCEHQDGCLKAWAASFPTILSSNRTKNKYFS